MKYCSRCGKRIADKADFYLSSSMERKGEKAKKRISLILIALLSVAFFSAFAKQVRSESYDWKYGDCICTIDLHDDGTANVENRITWTRLAGDFDLRHTSSAWENVCWLIKQQDAQNIAIRDTTFDGALTINEISKDDAGTYVYFKWAPYSWQGIIKQGSQMGIQVTYETKSLTTKQNDEFTTIFHGIEGVSSGQPSESPCDNVRISFKLPENAQFISATPNGLSPIISTENGRKVIEFSFSNGTPHDHDPYEIKWQSGVPKAQAAIDISLSSSTIPVNQPISISGSLTPPITASITLTFTKPDNSQVTNSVTTDASGNFTYQFTPDQIGTWKFQASWEGNENYLPAESDVLSFEVTSAFVHILPVPYDYQSATNWCGLASLAMILNYYGIQKHSWDIAEELQVPKFGGVIEAKGPGADIAKLFGTLFNVILYGTFSVPPSPSDYIIKNYPQLKAKAGYYASTEQIREAIEGNISAGYPLMLQLRNDNPPAGGTKGHFVAVVGYNSTGVFINDPSGALMLWLGKSAVAPIGAYVSWQNITKFETTNSEIASTLGVEGNPNPLDAKIGIQTDLVYADHGQLSHAVSIDLDKGLVWRGLFLQHFSVLDPQDTLYLSIPVYNHLNTTRTFDLFLEITGSDGAVYYSATENTQRVTVKPMFLSYAFFTLMAPLKLTLEKRYTIHIELDSLDGKRIDYVDLPPIDYVQSGTVIWMSEIQGRLYLHVYDSLGHHTGFNYQTNQTETGIPGSAYAEFSDGQTGIYLPANVSSFRYAVDAEFASQHLESYNITVNLLWNASVTGKWSKSETIQQGQTNQQTLQVNLVHGAVTIGELTFWQQFWYLLVIVVTLVGGVVLIFYRRKRHRRVSS